MKRKEKTERRGKCAGGEVVCVLEFSYQTKEEAKRIAGSIKVDDEGFVKTSVKGKKLVAEIEARNIPSLLHTLDDYLACLGVAEKAARVAAGEPKKKF